MGVGGGEGAIPNPSILKILKFILVKKKLCQKEYCCPAQKKT